MKLAGSRYITTVINSLPRPSFFNYLSELRSANRPHHPLHIAAARRQEALIIEIFKSKWVLPGEASSAPRNFEKSKLQWAAEIGHNATVKQQLLNGAELAHTDPHLRTALHFAAANGHEETVKLLLQSRTFLWAVNSGQIVRYATLGLSKTLEISTFDRDNRTPLFSAAEKGYVGIVRLLLKKGAKVGSTTFRRDEKTALALAAENGHVEIMRLILRSPGEGSGSWARYYWVMKALYWTARSGQIAAAKLLLEELVSLPLSTSFPLQVSQGLDGQDVVFGAVENGHEKMVRLLLENNVKASPIALEHATEKRQLAILDVLLDWGLRNGGYGGEEKIALLWAASSGDVEMVRLIFSHGTGNYKDVTDKDGRTALHCAAVGGSLTTWTRIRSYSERDPRWEHYHYGHQQVIEYLLLHGDVNIDATDDYGITALHYAVYGKKERRCLTDTRCGVFEPTIRLLLDHGADRRIKDSHGRLALHCAAASWNTEMFSLLLQQKSDLDERDKKGRPPLHYAVNRYYIADWNDTRESSPMIKLLLDEGANIDAQDIDGNTALHDAARSGKEDIFEQLQDRGAGLFIKNNFGLTAPEILAQWKAERMPKDGGGHGKGRTSRWREIFL